MRIPVAVLASCMLVTGTINTIATKLQDRVVVGHDEAGLALNFKHPAVQTSMMFAGEALLLIPYLLRRWWKAEERAQRPQEEKDLADVRLRKAFWLFAIPAMFDACGTTLLNLGLYYTYASVFQMLRGTLVVFAGMLTIVLLKRRLHVQHWLGIVLITAGAALVGASSIIYDSTKPAGGGTDHSASGGGGRALLSLVEGAAGDTDGGNPSAPNPLLGDVLVVLAQLCAATQFILEEKYLAKYHAPVLFAVGMEGAWGMALSCAAIPLLARMRGPDGLPLDSVWEAFREIRANFTLQWTTALTIASIGLFNLFGISVTKQLSGASRASIDACRTLLVWLVCLRWGWERFHLLQVVGFAVLLSGSSIYNDLLRSCLPAPEPRHRHRHRGEAADDAEAGLHEALLRSPSDLGPGMPAQHTGGAAAAMPSDRPPRGVRFAPDHSAPVTAGWPPRSGAHPPLRERYTMARSVTILPQVLSPHSLASVPMPSEYFVSSLRSDMQSYGSAYLSDADEEGASASELESDTEGRMGAPSSHTSPAPAGRREPRR